MCEGVDVCPSTGSPIEKAPCKVAMDFGISTGNTLDTVWTELLRVLELEDAGKRGETGYQMIQSKR